MTFDRLIKFFTLTFCLLLSLWVSAQSIHGADFKIDCKNCHTSEGWKIRRTSLNFNHDSTTFPLAGQHKKVDCNQCHQSLKFKEAKSTCNACHTDVHSMTVGNDCARCHTAKSWLVDEIPELHEQNGFPLTGAHTVLSCVDCHKSESGLAFNRIGNECVSCHKADYDKTTNPNHILSGFSLNCTECHEPISNFWGQANFHYFFPLVQGHDTRDCKACHKGNDFKGLTTDCVSCHLDDYNNAAAVDHKASGFSTNCSECHTLAPGWEATLFKNHDEQYFPIYSGSHKGAWNTCKDCHTTPSNYKMYSCIDCHEHNNASELAKEHDDENDYKFESTACLKCHPKGEKE